MADESIKSMFFENRQRPYELQNLEDFEMKFKENVSPPDDLTSGPYTQFII